MLLYMKDEKRRGEVESHCVLRNEGRDKDEIAKKFLTASRSQIESVEEFRHYRVDGAFTKMHVHTNAEFLVTTNELHKDEFTSVAEIAEVAVFSKPENRLWPQERHQSSK